jgi:hypothetical protein
METLNIKKGGIRYSITKEENTQEEYLQISEQLVSNLLYNMALLYKKYSDRGLDGYELIQGERQISTLILPSLSKICNGLVLAEVPTTRNCCLKGHEIDNSTGRIDYWCIYKEYSFVIEAKLSFDAFKTDNTREKVTRRWNTMIFDQLESVKEDIKYYEEETMGVIRLGLHFVIPYSDKKPSDDLLKEYKKILNPDIIDRIKIDISQEKPSKSTPNIIGYWTFPKNEVLIKEQTFPGIILVAKAFKPIQHKGSKK